MQRFIPELKKALKSEVRFDPISKALYSTDASIYQITPQAVVLPRTKLELVQAIQIASEYNTPIIARGAATGVAGGCIGDGLVIDCSKFLNRIIDINVHERYAIVQPGVVLDQLNALLLPHKLQVGPDTSTSNRATLGGMVATNASGSHSLKFGSMKDHILEIELILANGELYRFCQKDLEAKKQKLALQTTEGKIYRELERIRSHYGDDIKQQFPKISRRSSGYNLETLLHADSINIASLICGSEGTLGVISEIKIKLCPIGPPRTVVVLGFKEMQKGLEQISELLAHKPIAIELIDDKIINAGMSHPSMRNKLGWLKEKVEALIVIECESDKTNHYLTCSHTAFTSVFEHDEEQKKVWDLRKSGLGLLLSKRSYNRAVAFIEDIAIPPASVHAFIHKFKKLLQEAGKEAGIYGHIGEGCLHIRPYFDLREHEEKRVMNKMMVDVMQLVKEHNGVLSGEHGDGIVRSWTSEKMFGPRIYEAFTHVKHAFDPLNLMNPGKIVFATQTLTDNLRPSIHQNPFSTYFDFSREGGFELAVDMCNGNGACRKKEGTMCPSFQVTHDEKDSTRGRANALREMIHGKVGEKELLSDEFASVMDLCIQCKGCKTECPSQVDMAKMKSEYLYHLHKKKRASIATWIFGHLGELFSWTYRVSWLARLPFVKAVLGIAKERSLPIPRSKRFSSQFQPNNIQGKNVVLFIDTFTEFLHPELGLAAVKVLEALHFSVIAPNWSCCGRTHISKGYLPEAKAKLTSLVDQLYPYAKEGMPIIGLEPSCLLTLHDEAKALQLDVEKVETVAKASCLIDDFLLQYVDELATSVTPFEGDLLVHGHCHQKALVGIQAQLALLKRVVKGKVAEIPSGCCGMAGSFGYEKEHAAFSHKIGELVLFPAIRQSKVGTPIIASGTSCRSQIKDGTNVTATHFVQFLASLL